MENYKLLTQLKRTPASDHAISDRVTTRSKQTVARSGETNNFVNNHDQQRKIINHNLQTEACQTPTTHNNIYLVEKVKNHRHQNGKLEFLIKWLGHSHRHNTWEPQDHLSPTLVQEYFQQFTLEKSTPPNAVFMTRILTKEPSFIWRFCIPRPLALFYIFILWSSLVTAQPASLLTLDLGPLYDYIQPQRLGIFGFPSLKNFSHTMLQQEATVSTFRGEILRYSPVATIFPIYYCQLETITMACDYDIFTGKNRYHDVKTVLLPGRFCLQAALTHTVPIGRHNKTLIRVTDNHWKISVSPSYDCTFTMTIVKTYHNFHVRTYKAQLVGAANVIEQHLTNTPCSATSDTTLHIGSCIPQENPKHIIVWNNPQHNRQEMNTLRVHKIKQRGTYILISSLHVGGAIQQKSRPTRGIVQLDYGLVMWKSLRTSSMGYLTLPDTLRQSPMMLLCPCLKSTLCRHCFSKNKPWLVNGSVCASYNEKLQNYRNGWLVFFPLLLPISSINNQVPK